MTGSQRTQEGVVVSHKMNKTAVVQVTRKVKHTVFHKYFTKRKKFKVHDEKNECAIGDRVIMKESKPISREKRWVITQIIEKGSLD